MPTLTVGWASLPSPHQWNIDGRSETVNGTLNGATYAANAATREQLLGHEGDVVPVTWDTDPDLDGWVRIDKVETAVRKAVDVGLIDYRIRMTRLGGPHEVDFVTYLDGDVRENGHGLLLSEVTPAWAGPPVTLAVDYDGSIPTTVTRTIAGTGVRVAYSEITAGSKIVWSVEPADFYAAAARVTVDGNVRTARHRNPYAAGDAWELHNDLIRIRPSATAGRLLIDTHDGTIDGWEGEQEIDFLANGVALNEFDAVQILRPGPELAQIRLISRGAGQNRGRVVLDLALQRGHHHVNGHLQHYDSGTIYVQYGDAGTDVTPTGASSAPAVRTNTAIDGHRHIAGGGLGATGTSNTRYTDTAQRLRFFVGVEHDGASAITGDTADAVALQAMASLRPRTFPVVR